MGKLKWKFPKIKIPLKLKVKYKLKRRLKTLKCGTLWIKNVGVMNKLTMPLNIAISFHFDFIFTFSSTFLI